MLNPVGILRLEGQWFPVLLAMTLVYRMLVGKISLRGLFAQKIGTAPVSPERIQLLITTLALSGTYLADVLHSTTGKLPEVNSTWLYLFGGSSGIYASVKAVTAFKSGK